MNLKIRRTSSMESSQPHDIIKNAGIVTLQLPQNSNIIDNSRADLLTRQIRRRLLGGRYKNSSDNARRVPFSTIQIESIGFGVAICPSARGVGRAEFRRATDRDKTNKNS